VANEVVDLRTPLKEGRARSLRAGEAVTISGTAYIARDAAHKRLCEAIEAGIRLPFEPAGQIVYYAGPTPAPPGKPIGAVGPTTSYRMDPYVEPLLKLGLRGMVGKGVRSHNIKGLLKQYGAIYFVATGGAGALLASCIRQAEVIAYPELGPEALRRVEMDHFPAYVAYDAHEGDLYEESQARWRDCGSQARSHPNAEA
jgi:fumarate hydratase subunit beta